MVNNFKYKKLIIAAGIIFGVFFIVFLGLYVKYRYDLAHLIIKNNVNTADVYQRDTIHLKFILSDNRFDNKVVWKSSDNNIASVSQDGVVKAIGVGKVKIYSEVDGAKSRGETEFNIKKYIDLKNFVVKGIPKKKIYPKQEFKLKVELNPNDATKVDVNYSSSNPKVATVDKNGNVKALAIGTSEIKVYSKNHRVEEKIKIKVEKPLLEKVSYEEGKKVNIESGEIHQLKMKYFPEEAEDKRLVFTSSNPSVATVDNNGLISTHKPGSAVVTASWRDKSSSIKVNVRLDKGLLTDDLINYVKQSNADKLMIVAHPDDETLWGGGHLLEGNWFVVCLTNGNNPIRTNEFNKAMSISGSQHLILNYPDLRYKRVKDDWSYVKTGIWTDIGKLLKCKSWSQIATHNPEGEYGHIHHKMTSRFVTDNASVLNTIDRLYYFGTFYSPGQLPPDLYPSMDDSTLQRKMTMIDQYPHQRGSINRLWMQMVPFEYWRKAI